MDRKTKSDIQLALIFDGDNMLGRILGDSHNDRILDPKKLRLLVSATYQSILKQVPKPIKVDAILCSGISGAGVAFPLSVRMRVPVWIVRKEKEQTHSPYKVEASRKFRNVNTLNYIIVDDLIDSGDTILNMFDNMAKIELRSNCLGIFLYNERSYINSTHANEFWNHHSEKNIPVLRTRPAEVD